MVGSLHVVTRAAVGFCIHISMEVELEGNRSCCFRVDVLVAIEGDYMI